METKKLNLDQLQNIEGGQKGELDVIGYIDCMAKGFVYCLLNLDPGSYIVFIDLCWPMNIAVR